MLNQDRFKTAEERIKAFDESCKDKGGISGEGRDFLRDFLNWLALEAEEEKPENCPFCGRDAMSRHLAGGFCVECDCGYTGPFKETEADAIAAHNRVARA